MATSRPPTYDASQGGSWFSGLLRGKPILKWSLITSFTLILLTLAAGWLYWQSLYRGMPDLPTRYTVIEIATGTDHGTWETPMEVAVALAFAKLSLDDVEILTDAAPMTAAFAGR